MSGRAPDLECAEYDSADILKEDARIDEIEDRIDAQRHEAEQLAFETAALQYAISSCLDSCLDSLDLLYIPRESRPISDVAIAHDSWRQEQEPEPCSRDSWLRGAVPEGAITAIPSSNSSLACRSPAALTNNLGGTSTGSRPLSGASAAQRAALASTTVAADGTAAAEPRSNSIRRTSMSRSSGREPSTTYRAASASSTAAKDLAIDSVTSNSSRSQQKQQQTGKQPVPKQHDAEDRLRQELWIRRQQDVVTKEKKQKDEQARAALIAMQKELKGKDYTYDSSGKIVLLNTINPESLPAPPGAQFKVHTAADTDAANTAAGAKQGSTGRNLQDSSTGKLGASATSTAKSSSTLKGRNSRAATIPPGDFKQTASQTQPCVLETLRPAAGVVLRAGAAAKQGPKRESNGQTRMQYQQQAKAHNQQATRMLAANSSSAGFRASTVAGNASIRAFSASSAAGSTAGAAGSPNGQLTPQQAAAMTAGGTSGRASPAYSGPAVAATACNERSTPTPVAHQEAAAAAKSSLSGTASPSPVSAVAQRPPSPDVNLVLVAAADWGIAGSSPGYMLPLDSMQAVHKPSDKQIMDEFGRTTFLPKVRSPIHILKPLKTPHSNTASASKL